MEIMIGNVLLAWSGSFLLVLDHLKEKFFYTIIKVFL